MMMLGWSAWGVWPDAVLPPEYEAPQGLSTLRLSTVPWHSAVDDSPASTAYQGLILGDVRIELDGSFALSGDRAAPVTVGSVQIWDPDAALAGPLEDLGLAVGRQATVRLAEVLDPRASDLGTPLRDTLPFFVGTVRDVRRGVARRATIDLDDATLALTVPLQDVRYGGAGGLDGPEALEGRGKPVLLGQVYNAAPVALGNVDLGDGALPTYQYHYRAADGLDAVRIRGVTQTLVGIAPTAGQARDWPALGVFQLGATPDGDVTFGGRGDAVGGYVDGIADICWRICAAMGPRLTDDARDSASWAFAGADLPGAIGWYQAAPAMTALQALGEILGACRALIAGGRDGRLRLVDPFTTATDVQFDLAPAMLVAEPVPVALDASLSPPPAEVLMEYGRNWAVVSSIAGVVADADRQRLSDSAAPVARWADGAVEARVATRRILRIPGLYVTATGAQARAERIGAAVAAGRRLVWVEADRYLGQIDAGTLGRATFPGLGLDSGLFGVVLGWSEGAAARRLRALIFGRV